MKAEDATIEQILDDICGECIDGARLVHVFNDEVYVTDYEGRHESTGKTLKEALINHAKKVFKEYDPEYNKVDFR